MSKEKDTQTAYNRGASVATKLRKRRVGLGSRSNLTSQASGSTTSSSGAKGSHAVSPHFSQLLYYSLVSALFMVPDHFSLQQAVVLFRQLSRNKLLSFFQFIMASTICFVSVKIFSKMSEENLGVGVYFGLCWNDHPYTIDRVQIHHTMLFPSTS